MSKKRIYEVAADYGKHVNEVLDLLKKHNITKTNFSGADEQVMAIIHNAYDKKPEPPKPAKADKREPHKAFNANHNEPQKQNDKKNNINGQRNMQQNNQNQRTNNTKNGGRNNEGRPQNRNNNGNRNNEGRPQNRNNNGNRNENRDNRDNRQGGNNRPQRPVANKQGAQPVVHGESRAQMSNNRDRNNNRGEGRDNRENRQGGRNAGGNKNRNNKPQIKGSYATKESRPNRSAGHQMPSNRNRKPNNAPKAPAAPVEVVRPTYVEVGESINVQEFAKLIKREVNEVIKALFMLGMMVTINQDIDFDTAQLIGDNFGVEVGQKAPEEDPTEIPEVDDPPEKRVPRPPVITVMGHVDHGKTSLLDAIRKTNVTSREAGGITQHIGAYKVSYQGKPIVFLDTPGHEAFTAMRARGAQVTDVAILVVAADDGVMPQTIEAINHAKAAKVPIIVAINKIDREGANPDHVKQQLAEHELIPEDWGGDTIMVPVSAHKKTGIPELLEMILLVAEMQELKANPNLPAHGTIIEAQLDKGRGPVATVLVQRGTLHIGDTIIAGTCYGKVRAMVNDRGEKVKKALPSTPVEVLGLNDVPQAGDILDSTEEKIARSVAEKRIAKKKEEEIKLNSKVSLDDLFQRIQEGELKELDIVVKADVQGTIEALKASLEKIKNDEVKVVVVHAGVGAITESDVMLASAANALIIGFNVRPDANARKAAETEKVDVRTYRVIYDALNDVEAAIKGMLAPKFKEVIQGRVEVRQLITISKLLIAGCYVLEGKVTNSSKVRIVRDGIVIHEGVIESLRRFKDDVKEVAQGYECGITLEKYRDLKEGDIFEIYDMEEVAVD
jgi:translation initiation factor IF-2